jgi:glycosyltransferase involved in cell wall biosynthesis
LARELRQYDVVHAFSAAYLSFLIAPFPAMMIGRRLGRAVVLNYHSGEADDHLTRWRRTAIPAMRQADAIVVPSKYLVDVFGRHGLAATAISNIVDRGKLSYRRRTSLRPVFLGNRNMEPLYNVACTLRAFAHIQARLPDARLILAGDGTQRPALESLARELALRNVEFRGQRPPEAMSALYDEADVFVNSSDIDNMPNSIIEAFGAGLPVVTTDAGGIPYFVEHERNGLLVRRGDHEAMAHNAMRLLESPELAMRLADEGRRECLEKYVWSAVSEQWVGLYRELACERIPSSSLARGLRAVDA